MFSSDRHDSCSPIAYCSYKICRVVRPVLGAEICAFADAFDQAYASKHLMEKAYNKTIPMRMQTDSKSLLAEIGKESTTSEKRLKIDLKAIK